MIVVGWTLAQGAPLGLGIFLGCLGGHGEPTVEESVGESALAGRLFVLDAADLGPLQGLNQRLGEAVFGVPILVHDGVTKLAVYELTLFSGQWFAIGEKISSHVRVRFKRWRWCCQSRFCSLIAPSVEGYLNGQGSR